MSLCINPHCSNPQNSDNELFCLSCGSELLLQGHYRVVRQLGSGGFGVTFEITAARSNVPKVLKVLINNQPKAVELFQQEAQVLSQLNHPGIPKVEADSYFTYFPRNGQSPVHCLVMEKIVGNDLQKYMENRGMRPIDQTLAVEWLREIVDILQQVHNQNFFHRDIKPPNIMLKADGHLALIDFGTVREVTQTYHLAQSQGRVTKIVSAGYTPLEQMNSQSIPQSDFFALGRTFVYLLTGKQPLDSEIYDLQNDEIKWRDYAPQISSKFADLIDEMMARLPSQRPQNTGIILQRLRELNDEFTPPTQPSPTRRKLMKFLGFGTLGLVATGLIYAIFPKTKSQLVVSRLGDGDYKSISEAINNAKAGMSIVVRPGTYQESLILDKPIKIIGGGSRAEIIIESKESNCILMQTDYAEVRGLTLRGQGRQNNKQYFAVDVTQGQLILEDCDIVSDSLACVGVTGTTANPIIRRCQIHEGQGGGILVYENGNGTVEDSDIFANAFSGIEVRMQSKFIVRECRIYNGNTGGIFVDKQSQATVENCDIFENSFAGVTVSNDSNILIRDCKIYDGKQGGILFDIQAKGRLDNCEISGHKLSGMEIRNSSNCIVIGCKINRNNEYGVYVHDNAKASVENSDLTGNLRGAFSIDNKSQVQRNGNQE
ncbi:MAG TPA: right-handed parallel beta-helix repeat-containing protein [Trichormus sp. M33_DOE_039]|nr:right-handed parallel beta-helix repeat-containing protein [Trichormus sp. M33_DOE_039]